MTQRDPVTIPSNGSSLFQYGNRKSYRKANPDKSQSPQTGQVYFNAGKPSLCNLFALMCHNPLKRVKFISIP